MASIAVVYHSGSGHTAAQARAVGEGAASIDGADVRLVFVEDATAQPAILDPFDAVILGAPTYMGSVSAAFKEFMEATSRLWLRQHWRGKLAAGFTSSGGQSGDKLNTLIALMLFAMQHGMVWIGLGQLDGGNRSDSTRDSVNRLGSYAGAMSQANVDEGIEGIPQGDLDTAFALGVRVARYAIAWDRIEGGAA